MTQQQTAETTARLQTLIAGDATRAQRVADYDAAYFREKHFGCKLCGRWAEPDSEGGRRVAHAADCGVAEPWGAFAIRLLRAFSCSKTHACDLAASLYPYLRAVDSTEEEAINLGLQGKLGRLQDRVAAHRHNVEAAIVRIPARRLAQGDR